MIHSEKIDQIAPALVAAQKALRSAQRIATNPHLKAKYAPLDEVVAVARDALHAVDIMFSQSEENADATGFDLVTTLLHVSGQWVAGRVRMPLEKQTPQAAGSALTYGRRYGLSALIGIVPDDDDDGAGAERRKQHNAGPKGLKKDASSYSDAELHEMKERFTRENRGAHVARVNAELAKRRASWAEVPQGLRKPEQGPGVTVGNGAGK